MIKKNILLFVFVFLYFDCISQDSLQFLNAEQLLQLVRQFHPVARQADITVEKARADITIARGNFDPVFSYDDANKTFNGINYYNYTSPEIKIPTWYGIEVYGGVENLSGSRTDPTKTLGESNYLGISVPLLKDLIIDKRRAALQQAKIFNNMAAAEKRIIVNDLLLDAADSYWHWVKAYQTYIVIRNNVTINEKRFDLIKKIYQNGERPAIDTVEALAQLQSFVYKQNEYFLEFQNAGLDLSSFLWQESGQPYSLPETVVPQEGWENETNIQNFNLVLFDLLAAGEKFHPELLANNFKLEALDIEKKLKFQELLPTVDIKYNQLAKGNRILETNDVVPLLENNYQYGLKIEIPLRLSLGRGEYKMAKLKIEESTLDLVQKRLNIQLKIKSYYNEFITLRNQIDLQSKNYSNYQQLVKAEETRFSNGESSLFLINIRESKALEELEKLIELKTKFYKNIYTLQWSAGLLQ